MRIAHSKMRQKHLPDPARGIIQGHVKDLLHLERVWPSRSRGLYGDRKWGQCFPIWIITSVLGIVTCASIHVVNSTSIACWLEAGPIKIDSDVAQACLTLCDPMDCSPPGSSVHGIFQARILSGAWQILQRKVFLTASRMILDVSNISRISSFWKRIMLWKSFRFEISWCFPQ